MAKKIKADLEKTLIYNKNGIPKLKIDEKEGEAIYISSIKEYDQLMQVFEAGGWRWFWKGGKFPTDKNIFDEYGRSTYISYTPYKTKRFRSDPHALSHGGLREIPLIRPTYYTSKDILVTTQDFYSRQGITHKTLIDLGKWFDKKKPNRKSKMSYLELRKIRLPTKLGYLKGQKKIK